MSTNYQPGDVRNTEVRVHRAGAFGNEHVPTLTIYAHHEIPECESLDDARALYEREGHKVADALLDHLPGGVVDQVIVRLFQRRASLLKVTFGSERPVATAPTPATPDNAWDGCEWNPDHDCGALDTDDHHRTHKAVVIVGSAVNFRLCASCAALPRFNKKTTRAPIEGRS